MRTWTLLCSLLYLHAYNNRGSKTCWRVYWMDELVEGWRDEVIGWSWGNNILRRPSFFLQEPLCLSPPPALQPYHKHMHTYTSLTLPPSKLCLLLFLLVWFSGLSTSLPTKWSHPPFPVRTHAWVAGQVPSKRHARGNHPLMFLSLSFSFPSPLSKTT